MSDRTVKCSNCAAELEYAPGTESLLCPHCGSTTAIEIDVGDGGVRELDFRTHLGKLQEAEETEDSPGVRCESCGAAVTLAGNVDADRCPFCGSSILRREEHRKAIRPRSLLPFQVTSEQAMEAFHRWVKRLWFAPNDLKHSFRTTAMGGVYIPYWTYDCHAITQYRGERGDDYWVNVSYRDSEGKSKTRRVRKTRWRHVSGVVENAFDDILVVASESLPRRYARKLEPWDLENLTPFNEDYLTGFRVENYGVGLADGFDRAREIAEPAIRSTVRRDIGGDHQRIHGMNSDWHDISFKHLLLPIWLSAYRYRQKPYRFLVNGRTGEVQAERPYSWVKIGLAVVAALILAVLVFLLFRYFQG